MISVGVLSHILKFDDAMIGVLSCTSKILSSFVYAFATTTWAIYLGNTLKMANNLQVKLIIYKIVVTAIFKLLK